MRPPRLRELPFLLLAAIWASCSTYEIAIEPAPVALAPREADARLPLTFAVRSTYAPFVDEDLSTTDLYPRDRRLLRDEVARYAQALTATGQFASVTEGAPGNGLHCQFVIVSGREPSNEFVRVLSILLTLTLLPHEQREIVRLQAEVSSPSRASATYECRALVTSSATAFDDTRLRRPRSFSGPEHELVAALVARMATDGFLDRRGGAR